LRLKTIALVKNGVSQTPDDWSKTTSRLVFRKEYVDGLYRVSHFKHIWVIFGFHKSKETNLKVHPRHDQSIPIVGVFASCSPTRPNKLGLTLVRLVGVKGNVVTVRGLDAFDGSPVFDIKPPEGEIDYHARRRARKNR